MLVGNTAFVDLVEVAEGFVRATQLRLHLRVYCPHMYKSVLASAHNNIAVERGPRKERGFMVFKNQRLLQGLV